MYDVRSAYRWMRAFGIDPRATLVAAQGVGRFLHQRAKFKRMTGTDELPLGSAFPILTDYHADAGSASGHYFHMDLWAARKIYEAKPARHVDIGSRIDGFVSHLMVFREVEVVDIRPLEVNVPGLKFMQADATSMSGVQNDSLPSVSCLHAAEHFGLGRYGDPLEPGAYKSLISALCRCLARDGTLYFAVPVGRERVEFNAHRIFAPERIISAAAPLKLVSFSAVDDKGGFHEDVSPEQFTEATMACGMFEFRK